jgi:uncharacterized protein (DUF1778 family)
MNPKPKPFRAGKVGHAPKKNKDKRVYVRLNSQQLKDITAAAVLDGRDVSQYVRHAAVQRAKKDLVRAKKGESE